MRGHVHREVPQLGLIGQVAILYAGIPVSELSEASGGIPVQCPGMQLLGDVDNVAWHLCTGNQTSLRKANWNNVVAKCVLVLRR